MDIVALREVIATPLANAAQQTLLDMTGLTFVIRSAGTLPGPAIPGEICVGIRVTSTFEGVLLLGCSSATATALAQRVLGGAAEVTPMLVTDCLGEVANVIAGQAKALLAATPYHFTFATPTIVTAADLQGLNIGQAIAIGFDSDIGPLGLQLCL